MMNKIKIKKYMWVFLGIFFQEQIKTTDMDIEKNISTKNKKSYIQKTKKKIELIDLSNILNKKNKKKNLKYNKEKLKKNAVGFIGLLKKVRTGSKRAKYNKNKKIIKKNRVENNN